jgi:hypothetical protein
MLHICSSSCGQSLHDDEHGVVEVACPGCSDESSIDRRWTEGPRLVVMGTADPLVGQSVVGRTDVPEHCTAVDLPVQLTSLIGREVEE